MTSLPRAFAVLAGTVLLLTGCSSNAVEPDDLAQEVSSQLEATVGQAPDDVTCPEGLDAEVGAETRCTLTDGDATYGVSVTATAVDGDEVTFDIAVDEEPEG